MVESKIPFNVIIVFFTVFALIGLYWLDRLGLDAGSAYLWLFTIGVIFIIVAIAAKMAKVDFWLEIPINKTSERGLLMLMLGLLLTLGIFSVSMFSGLQFYSPFVMAPLASFSLSVGAETFSALQAATSPFWVFFISVLSASVIEEIVLGFGFVAMGSLLAFGIRRLLKIDFGEGNKHWDFFGAIIFSIILFAVLHFFNATYLNVDGSWNWSMFAYAAGFRGILNILIYKLGNMGLLFSIGVHAMNNAIFIGAATVWAALAAFPGGVVLSGLIIILIFFGIVSIRKLYREGELFAKDFYTWD